MKRCLSLWKYELLEKIEWNMVTWKRIFKLLKCGRCYWCRLRARKKSSLKFWKKKHLGEHHDLHVQSDRLLLADVFDNFRNMWLEIYEADPTRCITAPGLAWQGALNKNKVQLHLLTDINMLLVVEKGITGGICHSTYW